jgi:hypothetical protein
MAHFLATLRGWVSGIRSVAIPHLLGYDVADYDLLGGLTNCGYTPGEAASLAPVWAPLLNEWHLFGKPEDATAYAAVTAGRVPEHAPFFGYGIYQLG